MNARLTKIASRYYDSWTTDGIDDFHADVDEITAWLKREDLRTAEDADLHDLTDDEIDAIAAAISDMVKENLPKSYYILNDMEGYGSEYPICVDREEAERLVREWGKEDFDEVWRKASEDEIATYGRYDTDED